MSDIAVEIRGLRKRYGKQLAVDGLDLTVPRGAVFGLLGPNGAGKSTTFGIACGWLRQTEGSVTVLGVDSHQLHRLQGRVAALPQDAMFPANVTLRESLAHFARLSGIAPARSVAAADEALERVGLTDAAGKTGAQLSHGMHKRAGLAQAILGPPDVVFLDEPTSGLDPRIAHATKHLIAQLAPRTTVVVSSHNLAEIEEICTHGAILDHGRLTISGAIHELTRRSGELTVTVRGFNDAARAALAKRFGAESIVLRDDSLRVSYPRERDPAAVIRETLELLWTHGVSVLGVHRGTSLETAFLELTAER